MAPHRSIGNPNFPGGEIRGLNGVIIVANSFHKDGGQYRVQRAGLLPVLPDVIADQLPEGKPGVDAATDEMVAKFIAEHTDATWPALLRGWINALATHFETGSRHNGLLSVLTGALKEARAGFFPAAEADIIARVMFVTAATRAPIGGENQRTHRQANAEYESIRSWAVAQANAADLRDVRRRVEDKYVSAN